eukprot:5034366-Amphidinium_carterae.1
MTKAGRMRRWRPRLSVTVVCNCGRCSSDGVWKEVVQPRALPRQLTPLTLQRARFSARHCSLENLPLRKLNNI